MPGPAAVEVVGGHGVSLWPLAPPVGHTVDHEFGQQSGPPASAKQMAYLLSLLNADGFDFATARHTYGLTQRQARGKFSIAEASELIDRLVAKAEGMDEPGGAGEAAPTLFDSPVAKRAQARIDTQRDTLLRGMPAEVLADELERRGWAVIPPS